jgi:hypothetical protein
MSLPSPPQNDDLIITQFQPGWDQWELNDDSVKRIDPQSGETILHNYCKKISTTPLEVYRYLIETKGCDVNAQDKNHYSPIRYAFLYFTRSNNGNNTVILTYLLSQNNVDINLNNQSGSSLLRYACESINTLPLDIFKLLIETKDGDLNGQNNDGYSPLYFAIDGFKLNNGGDIMVLTYLLRQKNLNVNTQGQLRSSLLHRACFRINTLPIDVFKLLIETHGCDVNRLDNALLTPIHNALFYFNSNHGGDITVLRYLLTREGLDVNIKGKCDYNILHMACININKLPIDVFKCLIETMGCDVNALNNVENTPIHLALRYFEQSDGGDITVLAYLINQKNVNINIANKKSSNLLHYACQCHDFSGSDDRWGKLNAENDSILCQIVEIIAERCVQHILDETTS